MASPLGWIVVWAPLKKRIAVQERERRTSLGTLNVGQVTAQMTDSKTIFRYDGETRTLHYGTTRGEMTVRLHDGQTAAQDIARWLAKNRLIAPFDH